ncbi:hypothetical protein PG987_016599 [Apiospora arundinis]
MEMSTIPAQSILQQLYWISVEVPDREWSEPVRTESSSTMERDADRCDGLEALCQHLQIPDHSAMDASLQSAVCQNSRVAA